MVEPTHLKNMFVKMARLPQFSGWKYKKKCLKPPPSNRIFTQKNASVSPGGHFIGRKFQSSIGTVFLICTLSSEPIPPRIPELSNVLRSSSSMFSCPNSVLRSAFSNVSNRNNLASSQMEGPQQSTWEGFWALQIWIDQKYPKI